MKINMAMEDQIATALITMKDQMDYALEFVRLYENYPHLFENNDLCAFAQEFTEDVQSRNPNQFLELFIKKIEARRFRNKVLSVLREVEDDRESGIRDDVIKVVIEQMEQKTP